MNWYKTSQNNDYKFDTKTDIPFYDDTQSDKPIEVYDYITNVSRTIPMSQYMKEKKNVSSEVVYMSPDEYINTCLNGSYGSFLKDNPGVSFDEFKGYVLRMRDNPEKMEDYEKRWRGGSNPPMPYIMYYKGKYSDQEGYHRALLAKKMGLQQMPVLIIQEG